MQAILQMMADDWSARNPEDWDVPAQSSEWRSHRFKTDKSPSAADDSSVIDIEGTALAFFLSLPLLH